MVYNLIGKYEQKGTDQKSTVNPSTRPTFTVVCTVSSLLFTVYVFKVAMRSAFRSCCFPLFLALCELDLPFGCHVCVFASRLFPEPSVLSVCFSVALDRAAVALP